MRKACAYFYTIVCFALIGITELHAECSMEQAHAKMRALQQTFTEHSSDGGEAGRRYSFMARDTAMVGHLLASKQYGEACKRYDEIAQTYGIDIVGTQKKLAPVVDARAKAAGGCDVVTATTRATQSYQRAEQAFANQGLSSTEQGFKMRAFSDSMNRVFPLVQTDPNQACKLIAEVEREYGMR
jgi:hypothetical protein